MSAGERPVHQFRLHNQTMTLYSNLTVNSVKAVKYFAAINSIMLSQTWPPRLSYFSLDGNTVKTMKSKIVCTAMAEDVKRHNLILAVGYGMLIPAIYAMTPDGETFKLLFNISQPSKHKHNYPSAMSVDPKGDSLYMCLCKKIIKANFELKTMTEIYQGSYIQGFDMDESGETLYIGVNDSILRLSLTTGHITRVVSFKSIILNNVYGRNHIYASVYDVEELISVAIHERPRRKTFHKLITNKKHKYFMLCFVP